MQIPRDVAPAMPNGLRFTYDGAHLLYHATKVATVIELANRSPRKPEGLSEFSLARLREDFDEGGFVQIRAVPRSGGGRLEFRFHLEAVGDIDINTEACATHLLDAAQQFDKLVAVGSAPEIATVVDAAIGDTKGCVSPMRIVAMGLCPTFALDHLAITVDAEMLGEDLTYEVVRVTGWNLDEVADELVRLAKRHARRDELLRLAGSNGAIGWVDGAAMRILENSGLPLAHALKLLKTGRPLDFDFIGADGEEYSASLCWGEGTIVADLYPANEEWSFSVDCLSINHPRHPESVIMAWRDHRLGEIIEQDFVPEASLITDVADARDGRLDISLAIAPIPIIEQIAAAAHPHTLKLSSRPPVSGGAAECPSSQ